ncbi:MAG: sulfurtransferase [Candidatus Dormibacteria bacterium]
MVEPLGPLVGPTWLQEHLGDPELVLLDVRWSLPGGADRDAYLEGHLPQARFVDLDVDLAAPPGQAGRHPLPSAERFTAAMRTVGVSAVSRVVAYDAGSGAAARAWWLLRAAGHARVMVLDGGLAGWRKAGGTLESGEVAVAPGDFTAGDFQGWVSADATQRLLERGKVVLDARSRDRYLGESSALDPRPGHIPGARNLPWTDAYQLGWVRSPEELAQLVAAAAGGPPPEVAYCGSGVTVCSLILALESAGIEGVQLYPGSWSEWARDPERPVELGASLSPGG